ncbi:MAG: hypothetical protein IJ735_01805 [Clostridia bacterium]|nr:hypothetical protein [Clostridia bacterium]
MSVNKADFCFRVRLVIILSDLILGLVGIVYFFYPVVQGIVSSVLEIAVPALLLGWFYEDLRERFVPAQNQAKVFGFVSRFYLGIYLALGVLNLIYEMGLYFAELTVLEIVELALDPAVVLILGVVAYLNYRRLKNISEHSLGGIDNNEQQKPKDETIFKDFGF